MNPTPKSHPLLGWSRTAALLVALGVATGARAAEPEPPASPPPAPATTPAPSLPPVDLSALAAQVHVDAAIDYDPTTPAIDGEGPARLGQPVTLVITASAPREVELFAPVRPATGTFRLADTPPGTRQVEGDTRTETYRYTLVPLRLGVEKVPAIEVPWRPAASTEGGSTATPPLPVRVRGLLENEQNPEIAAAPAPVAVITTNWVLVWSLSVGAALVLAALLTWLVLRALEQRFRVLDPPPPPRPANELAHERLATLAALSDEELDGGERFARTIDVLREYLGARYRFDALEMTSKELLTALAPCDLKSVAQTEIEGLLDYADLVKFARITPPPAEARAKGPIVGTIVDATWEAPEPEEEAEALPRLEPATLRQRLYAGAIDGIIAGAAGILLLAGLIIGGEAAWGWTAIVAIGVLLTFRDALGRSAGKRMLGLSVVSRVERQPRAGVRQLVLRDLLLLVWPLTLTLELLVLRRQPLRLRLGDLMANTEVVQGGAK
ncbi:MAG: hypothetical protein EP329_10585 [Deltaproteobacteria bacterium]|nr:MAG: hypothetical protein EP329_10585 [Deltaproteobacteria bacterium]